MSGHHHHHLVRPPHTILGADPVDDIDALSADVALYGVPWDAGSLSTMLSPGQRFGPNALRRNNVSLTGCVADSRIIDLDTGREHLEGWKLADIGDLDLMPSLGAEENFRRISEVARLVASRDALPVAVGGDHSISFPAGRGALARFDAVNIVHFDAHADFEDEIGGSKLTHGSNLRRLSELPNVNNITALGLRHVWRETYDPMLEYGVRFASARQMFTERPADIVQRLVPKAENIYVSIDIDVLDGSIVPGTCLPEPGGLTYNILVEALAAVAQKGRIVGIDIVEINPMNDTGSGYSMAARVSSWVLFEFLSAIRESRR
jgi:agmatinase